MHHSFRGFHLIEILITLSIISILAAFCFPIYSQYIVQGQRLEAASTLEKLAIAMEKFHIENNTYENASLAALNFPSVIAKNNYQLIIKAATNNDYILVAKPLGRQAEKDTHCAQLILYSNDKKAVTGNADMSECW
jgi:type IV pilus assembly protein PilE